MLLPDNIKPELSVYYNSSILLSILHDEGSMPLINLYHEMKKKNDISFAIFILCLDWLYLIESAIVNEEGSVELCISKN
ncbi:ABC-three component system middle component 6 [Erysipelothrix rhusiopathiae]|uniref:ABC-three component system middle component 6 n=1 Tax=Erysipelothrix rhusiopathiae TaxID=1648 RepID=UPI0039E88768